MAFVASQDHEIVAGHRGIVVDLAILALGRGPGLPAEGFVEDVEVDPALQRRQRRLRDSKRLQKSSDNTSPGCVGI